MASTGFSETQSAYSADDPRALIGQFRRLGPDGPAYEIMEIDEHGKVTIEIIYSSEKVVCPLADILADPMAETIP